MKINWNEGSTKLGLTGLVVFLVGVFMIVTGKYEGDAIQGLLLLGLGMKSFYHVVTPDAKE